MEMWWLTGDVHSCSLEMWLLIEDVVAYWRCGGSMEMGWLTGDVVAHGRCGGLMEM